ncbi:MAG: DUF5606 domain-containing protein, partial [Bacteroidales bacterium]|nr:DUF5606 domain-containing protein [Bacteroidales bacterium]
VMIKEILAVTGKPGLYKLVSRGNKMLIVETLDAQKKKMPVYVTNQVVGLGDISVYTDDGKDIPLAQVFDNIGKAFELKPVDVDYKKATPEDIKDWMLKVLPNYDTDRVRVGDMRKMLQWYNILVNNGITEFLDKEEGEKD